ncbi:MAG: hypothetical protein KatS3mg111_4151 [Pirellulaceae bacterium]|nr:MAG: hypothetical protein KatS3mg111_4151 [Pirellulaceae bacterium]
MGISRRFAQWTGRLRECLIERATTGHPQSVIAQRTVNSRVASPSLRRSTPAGRTRRRSIVELLEPRQMMAADPIEVGVVYVEEDLGSDLHGDLFYVTFQGGAPETQLRELVIDGDRDGNGFGLGDVFFDTAPTGLGADHAFPFTIERLVASHPAARVQAIVDDGGTRLVLQFENFYAGDELVFSIDVDEVQFYDPNETDVDKQNENFDPVTSGIEFQTSLFTATFTAPAYENAADTVRFYNQYDALLSASGLPLPADNHDGKRDRTAGAVFSVQQTPKPISLAGTVFVDANEDLVQQPGEVPIAGVTLELFQKVGGLFQSTGLTTTTDANGHYVFPASLGLMPGEYEIREVQPDGYYSVGARPGRLGGASVGVVSATQPDVISRIEVPLGDSHVVGLDFAENLPVEISGHVCVASGTLDCFDSSATKRPLADVLVELFDSAGTLVASQRTAVDGTFRFSGLRAGEYVLVEHTPTNLINGGARAGSDGGQVESADRISGIVLNGGVSAVDYAFCELEPAEIGGHTWFDRDADGQREPGEPFLPGVTVTLWDDQGQQIAQTTTDENGTYRFSFLAPGTYRISEITPAGYSPGAAVVGRVNGQPRGIADSSGDRIDAILLRAGEQGVDYDFGETLYSSISGRVIVDNNGNCLLDAEGERPLAGVQIELLDASGRLVATTRTAADGSYRFEGLIAGTYAVREIQPSGVFHGDQRAGSGGGDDSIQDLIQSIVIQPGVDLVDYNFCELDPGSIAGVVFADLDFDCIFDAGEQPIANVEVTLYDDRGMVVARTRTDAQGAYRFDGLRPGVYAVHETQPSGFFQGGQKAPPTGGDDSVEDWISEIQVGPAQAVVHADFCEVPPAEISGFVFQDGDELVLESDLTPEQLRQLRDGRRTADDRPLAGVRIQLRALNGQPLPSSRALPGVYAGPYIEVTTDAHGFFSFRGIRAGSYHIYEMHPSDFVDGIDTPGTTTGFAINVGDPVPQAILSLIQLSDPAANPGTDAILAVAVEPGQVSEENNFSEVVVRKQDPPVPPLPPNPPLPPEPPVVTPQLFSSLPPLLATYPTWTPPPLYIGVGRIPGRTWHLSVINAGFPRGLPEGEGVDTAVIDRAARYLHVADWRVAGLDTATWYVASTMDQTNRLPSNSVFYVDGGRLLAGDFNGDGYDELVLFVDGEWFVDINGNGRWDDADLWARLGDRGDQPVIGDWDGDGKADIGVFGHRWPGDERALAAEPGLPEAENRHRWRPKNVPPDAAHAPEVPRLLQSSRRGPARADLIDHVFEMGGEDDVAVAGDFNGDGVATTGLFRDGHWMLDVDGDGAIREEHDRVFELGEAGDLPLVGDFDGDGIDEVAILRGNQILVDSDGDGRFDSTDQVFEVDHGGNLIVVGDFDGDGRDEPVVLQRAEAKVDLSARKAG